MPTLYVEVQVDIYKLPAPLPKSSSEVTLGDLHGNSMKFLFMLVKHGVATGINASDYSDLAGIYREGIETLTRGHLSVFNALLNKMTFKSELTIRLIGDELADRGSNDYFMLKLLEKLHQAGVVVEILLSNHGVEFIEGYEKKGTSFNGLRLPPQCACSAYNLERLLKFNMISREEITTIADNAYKPNLKAISYSLNEDQSAITIYSHAAIGMKTIQHLATKLKVPYADNTAIELAITIDKINAAFQEYVQTNTVHELYTENNMCLYGSSKGTNPKASKTPFEFLVWNRDYTAIKRPPSYRGYSVNFVHGHDSRDTEADEDHIYNLDNQLGKMKRLHLGVYTALLSNHKALDYSEQPCDAETLLLDRFSQNLRFLEKKYSDKALRKKRHAIGEQPGFGQFEVGYIGLVKLLSVVTSRYLIFIKGSQLVVMDKENTLQTVLGDDRSKVLSAFENCMSELQSKRVFSLFPLSPAKVNHENQKTTTISLGI